MKRLLPAVALLALALPATASAHANLVRTDPASGVVVPRAPAVVRVVFDDVVRVGPGIEAVRNGGGSVLGAAPQARGDTLLVPLKPHLPNGDYSVRWSIVSDDGHLESGVLAFGVGEGRAPPTAVLKAESTTPGAGVTATRWLFLAGVLAAVGISLYALIVLRRVEGSAARRIALVLGGASVLAAIGAGVEADRVGIQTRYGAAMLAGLVLAGVVAAGAVIALRSALVVALGLAAVPSVSGHALDPGLPRVNVAVDVVHVLAASAWVGVLLGLVVAPASRRRAGLLAAGAILLVGVTGALRAGFELTAASQLWSTSYGRTILVKTGIALATVGIGWLVRARLGRRVAVELALVAGLVVAVAVLVQLRPGRNFVPLAGASTTALQPTPNPPPPPADAIVLAQEAGPLAIALEAEPHRLTAIVLSPAGGGLSGLSVRFLPSGAAGTPCGSGCYSAAVAPGRRVSVDVRGFGSPERASFTVPARALSAAPSIRRFERAYRELPGVTYEERLASSPTDVIHARWRLERPSRLSYAVAGSGQGIVIGNRRWDRSSPRGRWQSSSQSPLPQPHTQWERATNARLLSVAGRWETVSFADPTLGAFFELTFDRRTLRPRLLRMTAAAHFMTDRYLGFSPAREIRPPR